MDNNTQNNVQPNPTPVEKKICKNCNAEIDKKAKVCPNCGKKFGLPTWALVLIIIGAVFLTIIVGAVGCTALVFKKAGDALENSITDIDWDIDTDDWDIDLDDDDKKDKKVNPGEKFEFDDLEITVGKEYTFTTVDNKYSEYYEKPVVRIPITVKNLKDSTHSLNMFYYRTYGPDGTEADEVNTYFDDNIDFAGNLLSGAEYTKYLYVIYTGDGKYTLEFSAAFSNKTTIELNVTK